MGCKYQVIFVYLYMWTQRALEQAGKNFKKLMKERVYNLNLSVMAIAYSEICSDDYDKFIKEFISTLTYNQLYLWELSNPITEFDDRVFIHVLTTSASNIEQLIAFFRTVINGSREVYLISIAIDPSDKIFIRYNTIENMN